MSKSNFKKVAATPQNPNWQKLIKRTSELYARPDEIRSPFARDYTRILHSMAYRRLKHKTQVFFNIDNDHICTRMEHVAHVESVSSTIANHLGLNCELTKAIAIGHDLGHAPFGHQGETVIKKLCTEYLEKTFWHERNGLYFVDNIELLEDNYKMSKNLNLTYAVRDGIISHCGEVNENGLRPRSEFIDFNDFKNPGQYQPVTWEGCVVKLADKIAYVGRDIEDAISLGFLSDTDKNELLRLARINDEKVLNTTVIMHNLIIDVCKNSSPEKGICLSKKYFSQLNEVKDFNYKYIYRNERFEPFKQYSELVITQIFKFLYSKFDGEHSWLSLENSKETCPLLVGSFQKWLAKYCLIEVIPPKSDLRDISLKCENTKVYGNISDKKTYIQAIIDYISGMTDSFAIKAFNELLRY